jgi:pseudouridine-5'-phosphate glycosidase
VRGPSVTPFLLAAIAEETVGESIETNIALLRNNTRVAAEVALRISELG